MMDLNKFFNIFAHEITLMSTLECGHLMLAIATCLDDNNTDEIEDILDNSTAAVNILFRAFWLSVKEEAAN